MEELFLLIGHGFEWEDIQIFDDLEEAKKALAKCKNCRIEILRKTNNVFLPTYENYEN